MSRSGRGARWWVSGVVLALMLGCSGEEDEVMSPVGRTVLCQATTPVGANQVGMECPASSPGDLLVTVVIGGPSTSTDIYGVKFDLVFDSTALSYQAEAGLASFLEKEGGTTQVLASVDGGDPDRLVAAITLQGAVGGVQVTDPEETVVGFLFRGLNPGMSTVRFENGQTVDSTLAPIGSVTFVGSLQIEVQ